MIYLVTYDVPQEYNPIRTRIAQVLKNWGLDRLQYSVFVGELTRNEAETVALRIKDILGITPADVRMVPICKNCLDTILVVSENQAQEMAEEELSGVTLI